MPKCLINPPFWDHDLLLLHLQASYLNQFRAIDSWFLLRWLKIAIPDHKNWNRIELISHPSSQACNARRVTQGPMIPSLSIRAISKVGDNLNRKNPSFPPSLFFRILAMVCLSAEINCRSQERWVWVGGWGWGEGMRWGEMMRGVSFVWAGEFARGVG